MELAILVVVFFVVQIGIVNMPQIVCHVEDVQLNKRHKHLQFVWT